MSQRFGSDAKSDNAMMKTVAIVSMVYLPGTFVSVCAYSRVAMNANACRGYLGPISSTTPMGKK